MKFLLRREIPQLQGARFHRKTDLIGIAIKLDPALRWIWLGQLIFFTVLPAWHLWASAQGKAADWRIGLLLVVAMIAGLFFYNCTLINPRIQKALDRAGK